MVYYAERAEENDHLSCIQPGGVFV